MVARADTAEVITERGLRVQQRALGDFLAHPRGRREAATSAPDVLIVATKAAGLEPALERIEHASPRSCCRC